MNSLSTDAETFEKASPISLPQTEGVDGPGHYFNEAYLYSFATQHEVKAHVRTQGIPDDVQKLPEILAQWRRIQAETIELQQAERGLAESIVIEPVPEEALPLCHAYAEDSSFKQAFSGPWNFAMVEVDHLVAAQRGVNLDHVNRLVASVPQGANLLDVLPMCLAPSEESAPVQHLEVGPNTHVFTSPSTDLRFLGSYPKNLALADSGLALAGGVPKQVIMSFIGFGAAPINAYHVAGRVILHNGFHRVYALRKLGWKRIPVVLQTVRSPALELPPHIASLPREYLLSAPRPALMGDFFRENHVLTLRIKKRLRVVTVTATASMGEAPC